MSRKLISALVLAASLGSFGVTAQAVQPMSDEEMSKVSGQGGFTVPLLGIVINIGINIGGGGGDHDGGHGGYGGGYKGGH